jgi:hypothetical protein
VIIICLLELALNRRNSGAIRLAPSFDRIHRRIYHRGYLEPELVAPLGARLYRSGGGSGSCGGEFSTAHFRRPGDAAQPVQTGFDAAEPTA